MIKFMGVGKKTAKQGEEYSSSRKGQESRQRQAAKEFSRALSRAKKVAPRDPELAVSWCRYAATLAWTVNLGFFYSHETEQLLAEIGRKQLRSALSPTPSKDPPRRFLHVMSVAYGRGGHTRVVSRWIDTCAQCAPSEHHSILITMQEDDPLPTWLSQSAQKTGGELFVLPSGMTWLQLAAEIRSRSLEFDAVVLHIHPNDPLPNLAFYDQPGPVLFFRHADHVFNLGIDVARVVADLRPMGRAMSARFCSPVPRNVLLPMPLLDQGYVAGGKADARKKLGLPADALIALTIGEPVKFTPVSGYSFRAVVQSLCSENPRLVVVAVGPSESKPFPGLAQSVGGRFMPVGFVNDRGLLEFYYRAADVYLDAYPTSSITCVTEAALHGLPVQRLCVPNRCLMWSDAPALDFVMRADSRQDDYVARVLEWLEWPEEKRLQLGSRFRDAVLHDHCGASWKTKWLDPAVTALGGASEDNIRAELNHTDQQEPDFPGLGEPAPESGRFDGMLFAGIILSDVSLPRPIQISGAFLSIKRLLFHTPGDATTWKRLLMLRALASLCLPMWIRLPARKVRSAIFKKSQASA